MKVRGMVVDIANMEVEGDDKEQERNQKNEIEEDLKRLFSRMEAMLMKAKNSKIQSQEREGQKTKRPRFNLIWRC